LHRGEKKRMPGGADVDAPENTGRTGGGPTTLNAQSDFLGGSPQATSTNLLSPDESSLGAQGTPSGSEGSPYEEEPTREIKIVIDNLSGCEFQLDGEWFMGRGGWVRNAKSEIFTNTAILHFVSGEYESSLVLIDFCGHLYFKVNISTGHSHFEVIRKEQNRKPHIVPPEINAPGLGGVVRYWEVFPAAPKKQGQKRGRRLNVGRQLCVAFGSPVDNAPYNIITDQVLPPLQLNLRNEWARAAQQAKVSFSGVRFSEGVHLCE